MGPICTEASTYGAAKPSGFSAVQLCVLKGVFEKQPFISKDLRAHLSLALGISERQIKVWFQNRRQRSRRRQGRGAPAADSADALTSSSSQNQPHQLPSAASSWGSHENLLELKPEPSLDPFPDPQASDRQAAVDGLDLWSPEMTMECVTECTPPFSILWATCDWLTVTGFSAAEIRGNTFQMMQGADDDSEEAADLVHSTRYGACASVQLVNYTKMGRPFVHCVTIEPLIDSKDSLRLFKVRTVSAKPYGAREPSGHR